VRSLRIAVVLLAMSLSAGCGPNSLKPLSASSTSGASPPGTSGTSSARRTAPKPTNVHSKDLCGAQYQLPVEAVMADALGSQPTNVTCDYKEFALDGHPAFQGHWSDDGDESVVLVVMQPETSYPTVEGGYNFDVRGCPARWVTPILVVTCGSHELQIRIIARKDTSVEPVRILATVAVTRTFG
jgi:hypothetical protein